MSEVKLYDTMDANIWAHEFNRILVSNGEQPIDVDTMRAWFANAIMCGWDHAHWKLNGPYVPPTKAEGEGLK